MRLNISFGNIIITFVEAVKKSKVQRNITRLQKAALSTSHQLSSVSSCSYQMTFVKNGFKCVFVSLNFVRTIVFELSQ